LAAVKLDSKTSRLKLEPQRKPYYYALDEGYHLGYRRLKNVPGAAANAGRWVIRRYVGDNAYKMEAFAWADDVEEANGETVLTFSQAKARCRDLIKEQFEGSQEGRQAISVLNAVEEYLKGRSIDPRSRLTRYVLADAIANESLRNLTADMLREWRGRLPKALAPATVRRICNDFRAALNDAARKHRRIMPLSLPVAIKDGFHSKDPVSSNPRDKQVLDDNEIRQIIKAAWLIDAERKWDGDLARVVTGLAATGTRFSQLIRMTVGDVQIELKRLMVPVSRKGRGAKSAEQIAVRVGEDVIATLSPALTGRKKTAPLFERWRSKQVSREIEPTSWVRDRRGPWQSAAELTRPWKEIVLRAELPEETIPYCLRHSSIVRGLRAGLPIRLVAALHDTSTAMIEKHYAAFIVDALDELAAKAIVPLT